MAPQLADVDTMAVPTSSPVWVTMTTGMNPDNGAVYWSTPTWVTFSPTLPTFTSMSVTGTPAAYGSGYYDSNGESATYVVGEAYSSASTSNPVPQGFTDWSSYQSYTAAFGAESNGTSSTADPAVSPSESTGGSETGKPSTIKIITAAVPAVIGIALIVAGVWLCCRCKKRRRDRRDQGDGGRGHRDAYGQMSEVEHQHQHRRAPTSASAASASMSRTGRYGSGQGSSAELVPSLPPLTRADVQGIVSPSPRSQYLTRSNDRIDLVYPSRPRQAALSSPTGMLHPHQHQHLQQQQRLGPGGLHAFPRAGSNAGSSSRHSRWTDDSEYDVMAEDGSTITRTLSTTSTRRTVGRDNDDESVMGTGAREGENPFDHPAYTYRAAPQRSATTLLSRGNTLRQGEETGTGTWTSGSGSGPGSVPPSMTHNSTLSPTISPHTPTPTPTATAYSALTRGALSADRPIESDAYSIHSSEDGIFGPSASVSRPHPRPGVRREPTIIRHADSYAAGPGRYSTKVERAGRDDAGVVELPPLYEDATSGWTR